MNSTEPYDRWADDARSGLIDEPAAMQLRRRGDRPADLRRTPSPAELRERATMLLARLAEATGDALETMRDVDDDELGAYCAGLERRIGEAKGKR